jgi:hypothetical protein
MLAIGDFIGETKTLILIYNVVDSELREEKCCGSFGHPIL